MGVLSPLLTMLTNPATGLAGAIVWMIANWTTWDDMIIKARQDLHNLDDTVTQWFKTMSSKDGWEWLGHVESFYMYMKKKDTRRYQGSFKIFGPTGTFSKDLDYVVKKA